MQQKVKWVLVLIISFLIVIDALQMVWLYNNYKEEKVQYERILTNAIGQATASYQLHKIRNMAYHAAPIYVVSSNSPINLQQNDNEVIFTAPSIKVDEIEGALAHSQRVQIQTRNEFDIKLFDSLFKDRLAENKIHAAYLLDTSAVPQAGNPGAASKARGLVATKAQYPDRHNDYPVRTAAMLVNTYGNLFVYASFQAYPQFIYRKMFWPLVTSLFIFIVTNLAFIFVVKTIRQQKKINEIKNDFINNMTHELRTPITVATTAIDAILNHHGWDDRTKTRSYLATSKAELLHLDHLVEKILNIAVEDNNDLQLTFEKINVRQLLSTIVENHKLIAPKEARFYLDADDSLEIRGDRLHLANAINNVIDNAVKYSNDTVAIHINCSIEKEELTIAITDNGIGIEKEYLPQLFQPFSRVPKGDLHDIKGFGLGLSYVKKIIEKHGGHVEVRSNPRNGSAFTLFIPTNK